MFDHVKFGVSDYAASKAFFLKALEPLGVAVVSEGAPAYGVELSSKGKASLCLYQTEEKPVPLHLAFTAENRQQVGAFYRAAMEAVAKTTVRLLCARSTTRTIMQLSSLARTGTTSRWFVMNPRPNPFHRGDVPKRAPHTCDRPLVKH
jgi:glyoxalase/bleomycin resistance protein/dioxygenase superfamily protein